MTYAPVLVEAFGGLNTNDDPTEVGFTGATGGSNFDLGANGRVTGRAGYTVVASTVGTTELGSMCFYRDGSNTYVVSRTNTAQTIPISLTGANGSTLATAATTNNGMVAYGSLSTSARLYLVDGTATMRRLASTTWTSVALPASMTSTNLVAIKPGANRLAIASASTVWFSGPDNPETFGVDDFVTLDAGDGESILAMATWRDKLFVFKSTKFYVFGAESVDTTGGAVFNYYTVKTGVGVAIVGGAVSGREGVYHSDQSGVWVTTGDVPVRISTPLGDTSLAVAPVFMYSGHRFYLFDVSNDKAWVFDTESGVWMYWVIPVTGTCVDPLLKTLYVGDRASKKVCSLGNDTTDAGASIAWSYRSGLSDLGSKDRKVARETSVWCAGSGTVALQIGVDTTGNADSATSTSLTTGSERVARVAVRGTLFEFKLSGTSASDVAISGLVLRLRDQEEPK